MLQFLEKSIVCAIDTFNHILIQQAHYKGTNTKHPDIVLCTADTAIKVIILPQGCAGISEFWLVCIE